MSSTRVNQAKPVTPRFMSQYLSGLELFVFIGRKSLQSTETLKNTLVRYERKKGIFTLTKNYKIRNYPREREVNHIFMYEIVWDTSYGKQEKRQIKILQ